jgi:hypothetical protein
VGELGFAVGVRIDIAKEVTFLQSLQANPGPNAWKVYRQVIAYLKESPTSPIRLGSDLGEPIVAYIDVGYANHTDSKSHTGLFITVGRNGGPIYVSSKKQKLVTNSTGESEVTGLAEGMKHCIFAAKIHQELGLSDKIKFKIMEDNESAIHMVNNGEGVGGKAKHFRVRYHFVTEMINSGMVKIQHCSTDDMIADYLTKGMIGAELRHQVVRAMYQGDVEEWNKRAEAIRERLAQASKRQL